MALDERRLEELERVVDEQAALHRIAILVARGGWDGDTIRVIGRWGPDAVDARPAGAVLTYGGDTLTARVVETAAPARIDSADDLKTAFGRQRWDRKDWGVVSASRTEPGDPCARPGRRGWRPASSTTPSLRIRRSGCSRPAPRAAASYPRRNAVRPQSSPHP